MKTIFQWMDTIKDPKIRKMAKENYRANLKRHYNTKPFKRKFDSLSRAIYAAFIFANTEQGHTFWHSVSFNNIR